MLVTCFNVFVAPHPKNLNYFMHVFVPWFYNKCLYMQQWCCANVGVHCPVNGDANCALCDTGFTINNVKTQCIRMYDLELSRDFIKIL